MTIVRPIYVWLVSIWLYPIVDDAEWPPLYGTNHSSGGSQRNHRDDHPVVGTKIGNYEASLHNAQRALRLRTRDSPYVRCFPEPLRLLTSSCVRIFIPILYYPIVSSAYITSAAFQVHSQFEA